MGHYHDENGHILKKWVLEEAEKTADSIYKSIKSSQLRKFYNDFKALEAEWRTNSNGKEDAFARILPYIKLNKAKVAYAKSRKVVPEAFKDWLWKHIDQIEKHRDFEAFMLHFEAVVGFAYGNGLKDNG